MGAVAGVVGMVPEGLVLLTSLAFGIAAVTLARRQVLVQELPAVEVLARVDVVCLDKTGTLTEGSVAFDRVELLGGSDAGLVAAALGAIAAEEAANATLLAIREAHPAPIGWTRVGGVAFSSARRWSATEFAGHGGWWLGAAGRRGVSRITAPSSPARRSCAGRRRAAWTGITSHLVSPPRMPS